MPTAIILLPSQIPAILDEDTDQALLAALSALDPAFSFEDAEAAREGLAALPEPSGWFESVDHAEAYLDQVDRGGATDARRLPGPKPIPIPDRKQ